MNIRDATKTDLESIVEIYNASIPGRRATADTQPIATESRRAYHWQTLLRARAIENQMFIAGCNRVGESKGEHFGGGSAVIDPWGEAIIEGGSSETLLTAEIDLDKVDEVRNRIKVFEDRRPEVY